jgi:hypothetical protein
MLLVSLVAGCGAGSGQTVPTGAPGSAASSAHAAAAPGTVSAAADQLRDLFTGLSRSLPREVSVSGLVYQEAASCAAGTSRGEVEVKLIPSGSAMTAAAMKSLVVAFLAQRGWRFGSWSEYIPDDVTQNATARKGSTYILGLAGTGGTGSDATVLLDGHTACLPGTPVTRAEFT